MRTVEYSAVYVGHGALNYIQVKDGSNNVVKKIIVDAGSTDDGLTCDSSIPTAASNKEWLIDDVKASSAKQVIICITHVDKDHYSYVVTLIDELAKARRLDVIKTVYIGSVPDESSLILKANRLYNQINTYVGQVSFSILGQKMVPENLWSEEGVQLWALFNYICDEGGDVNANSANYAVKSTSKNVVLWFTGDSTGKTFNTLMGLELAKINPIKAVFDGCFVYMTVPHHGSIDTLMHDDFIYVDQNTWKWQNWRLLCAQLGISAYDMVASFGAEDKFRHPSGVSMHIYASMTPQSAGKPSPSYLAYYKTELRESTIAVVRIIDENSYIQRFADRPYVQVTCRYDGTKYDTSSVKITI